MYVCSKYVPIHHAVLNNIFEKRQCFFLLYSVSVFLTKTLTLFKYVIGTTW